jgi:(S)-ureidoglycine aminohydrolase
LQSGRARLTEAYLLIPQSCQTDIVISFLPGWEAMRMWVLSRPLSGLAETFSHYLVELGPGGGCDTPEVEPWAQAVLYVEEGGVTLTLSGETYVMEEGGYAYIPPNAEWSVWSKPGCRFHWYRKLWTSAPGVEVPLGFVTRVKDQVPDYMPETEGSWSTTRFVSPYDMSHDFHVNIVNFTPGGTIPFEETHVMEHSIYVLEGKGVYRFNRDWIEMQSGDVAILRAFCPQACYAGGPEPFRYLLYKDVNRHPRLALPGLG